MISRSAWYDLDSLFDHRYRLTEPDDMRSKLRAELASISDGKLCTFNGVNEIGVARASRLSDFSVEMKDIGRAGSFMEVVDILGDDHYVVKLLEVRHGAVSRIGFGRQYLPTSLVIESQHELGASVPSLGAGDLFDSMILPKSVHAAESG